MHMKLVWKKIPSMTIKSSLTSRFVCPEELLNKDYSMYSYTGRFENSHWIDKASLKADSDQTWENPPKHGFL